MDGLPELVYYGRSASGRIPATGAERDRVYSGLEDAAAHSLATFGHPVTVVMTRAVGRILSDRIPAPCGTTYDPDREDEYAVVLFNGKVADHRLLVDMHAGNRFQKGVFVSHRKMMVDI
jgi:hypothetical protein